MLIKVWFNPDDDKRPLLDVMWDFQNRFQAVGKGRKLVFMGWEESDKTWQVIDGVKFPYVLTLFRIA